MTRLVIVRHGNTFTSNEMPRRVGGRTDISLVESGIEQARSLGRHFKKEEIIPDAVFTSELKRTRQTAKYILDELSSKLSPISRSLFNEIDYGPDENKLEEDVVARIGEKALKDWDSEAIVPNGWVFNPDEMIDAWGNFSAEIIQEYPDKVVMVVTSNGIARFAPYLTGNFSAFNANHSIKLKTGSYGIMDFDNEAWSVLQWGIRPK